MEDFPQDSVALAMVFEPMAMAPDRLPFFACPNPLAPSSEDMLEAMRRKSEHLRNRLVDTEREFIRITRHNEMYREELVQLRQQVRPHCVWSYS